MKNNNNITQPQRQQTSVIIEGLDTSTPDDLVKDGKCSKLHNLRIKDGAWRPVHQHPIKTKIRLDEIFYNEEDGGISPDTAKVVYHHPAAGEGTYIVETVKNGKYYYYSIKDTFSSPDDTQGALIATFDEEMKISHFGKVLTFSNKEVSNNYLFNNGTYNIFIHNIYPSLEISKFNGNEGVRRPHFEPPQYSSGSMRPNEFKNVEGNSPTKVSYYRWLIFKDGIPVLPNHNDRFWWGEVALFVCYRMEDGTTLQPSPMAIIASEDDEDLMAGEVLFDKRWSKYYDNGVEYDEQYIIAHSSTHPDLLYFGHIVHPQLYLLAPTLTITIPSNLNTELITGCAIYATRVHPIFKSDDNDGHYAKTILPEQPFYLAKEIPIRDFNEGVYSFDLDWSIMENIEHKPLYTPLNNSHSYSPNITLDFNNRKHIADINVKLFDGYNYDSICSGESSVTKTSYVQLDIDNNKYWVSPGSSNYDKFKEGFNRIISYPDYRAKQYVIDSYGKQTTGIGATSALHELTPSVGNNIAYYTAPSQPTLKYPAIDFGGGSLGFMAPYVQPTFRQSNKIMVSSLNNPFSWPFENTYAVGSDNSKILALQSAAIEMADSKFGEMPLYAFTEEGIFALQAGESTLYSSVIPINYDKIIHDEVLAINYNLAYITEKGLHLLNGNGSQLISSPLNGLDGSPMDMWGRVKLLNPQSFNEIICYDEHSGKAYIFNLDHQYWSSRDMQGLMINTNKGVLEDGTIIDVTQENDAPQTPYSFITRPIKLGDLEFKRLETIIPRMQVVATKDINKMDAQFNIDAASNHAAKAVAGDGLMYPELLFDNMRNIDITSASMFGNLYIRRTPYSAKYFRFRFRTEKAETAEVAITNIDVEWYHKFLRKMR